MRSCFECLYCGGRWHTFVVYHCRLVGWQAEKRTSLKHTGSLSISLSGRATQLLAPLFIECSGCNGINLVMWFPMCVCVEPNNWSAPTQFPNRCGCCDGYQLPNYGWLWSYAIPCALLPYQLLSEYTLFWVTYATTCVTPLAVWESSESIFPCPPWVLEGWQQGCHPLCCWLKHRKACWILSFSSALPRTHALSPRVRAMTPELAGWLLAAPLSCSPPPPPLFHLFFFSPLFPHIFGWQPTNRSVSQQQCHRPELGWWPLLLTVLALALEAIVFEFDKPDPEQDLFWLAPLLLLSMLVLSVLRSLVLSVSGAKGGLRGTIKDHTISNTDGNTNANANSNVLNLGRLSCDRPHHHLNPT